MDKEHSDPPARDSSCDSRGAHHSHQRQPAEIVHQFPTGCSIHGTDTGGPSSSSISEPTSTTRPRGIFQMTIPLSSSGSGGCQVLQHFSYSGDGPEYTKPVGGGEVVGGPNGQLFSNVNASSQEEAGNSGGDDLTSLNMQAASNYLSMSDSQKTTGVIKVGVWDGQGGWERFLKSWVRGF